jgi:UDP-glucose 4-epimerase
LAKALQDCDEIVDLAYATVPQTSFVDPIYDLESNLPASLVLLEEAAKLPKLRRLVFVSSGGTVYGPMDRLPVSEEAPTRPVSPYGITKLTIERYALMFHRLHNLPVTIVRPSNAYGLGQKPFTGQGFVATAMGQILRREKVKVFGENGTVRDYVHVRDVASGILAAMTCGAVGEIYNIGSGVGRDNRAVLSAIAQLAEPAGYPVEVEFEPERPFDVPANILNFGRLLACSGWLPTVSFEAGLAEMWHDILESTSRH